MIGFTSCMCIEEVIVGDVRNGNQITYSFYIVISYMGWNVLLNLWKDHALQYKENRKMKFHVITSNNLILT